MEPEIGIWQIAFGVIQMLFTLSLGWFIKILISTQREQKAQGVKISDLETDQAVTLTHREYTKEALGRIEDTQVRIFNVINGSGVKAQ